MFVFHIWLIALNVFIAFVQKDFLKVDVLHEVPP